MANFDLNLFLEILNGSWAVLTCYFLVFLTLYLYYSSVHFKLSWHDWFVALPLGMTVAFSLYVNNLGNLISRGSIWLWRYTTNGKTPFSSFEIAVLCLGSLLGALGLLFMIRVYTKPFFGEWPWIIAGLSVVGYIIWSLTLR